MRSPLRPTVAIVDCGAIQNNVGTVRRLAGGTNVCAIVKANGYGHGAVEAARSAITGGASWLGVATVDEGIQLREAGITTPTLILSEPIGRDAFEACVNNTLTVAVYSEHGFALLDDAAKHAGTKASAHLKLDTGMHRVGLPARDVGDAIAWIKASPNVLVNGLFTHFACADDESSAETTLRQIDAFDTAREVLRKSGIEIALTHACNSAGAMRYPQARYDMVRSGIAIYGLAPDDWMAGWTPPDEHQPLGQLLLPAMSLVSQVSMVKELASGDGVGYGHVWHAPADTTIAIIPIGYADGLARNAGRNAMSVLIDGHRCPIVANVTMDQLMVDIGQLVDRGTSVAPGDPVVLIGSQGAESIGAWEWGLARDSLAYELVCAVGERVPRRYLERA